MNRKKRKNKEIRAAAAVFGAGIVLAAIMFAATRNNAEIPDESEITVMGTNIFESETSFEENAETEESSVTKAYIVTAQTEDIMTGDGTSDQREHEDESTSYADGGETDETTVSDVTKTVITHRDRSAYNGSSVYVDMENISQDPELPVGCEITALAILLGYWGFNADKCDLARNYLPISSGRYKYEDGKTYKDSFFDYFIGDPFSRGYGCFSNAIESAADSYINDNGGGYRVKNISGCDPDTLYRYLEDEIPVIVWATDGMIEPEYYETWYDIDTGEQLDWYLNEHCAVLVGFDMDKGTVTLNDPRKGIIDYDIDKFETRFSQMHSQALVILPEEDSGGDDYYVPAGTETETETQTEKETEKENESVYESEDYDETKTESETVYDESYKDDESYDSDDNNSYEIEIDED